MQNKKAFDINDFSDKFTQWEILHSLNLELLNDQIDYFKKYNDVERWGGGPQPNGVNQFPYPLYYPGMNLSALIECIGGYDYEYDKNVKKINEANLCPTDLDLAQIRSYLTFIIRGERFCDGHIASYMRNSVLLKLCLRLDDIAKKTMTKESPRGYSLSYIKLFSKNSDLRIADNSRYATYNEEDKKWILTVQLDKKALWSFKALFNDDGTFDKYVVECPSENLSCELYNEKIRSKFNYSEQDYMLLDQLLSVYLNSGKQDFVREVLIEASRASRYIYYQLKSGLIFKINQIKQSCYRLNPKTNLWEEDPSLFSEFEWGSIVGYKEIEFDEEHRGNNLSSTEPVSKLSRYQGTLLGGAVGDALGYPIEFWNEPHIFKEFGKDGITTLAQAGTTPKISDDTQMTLFAANAIIYAKTNNISITDSLKHAYLEWLDTQVSTTVNTKNKMWIYEDKRLHALRAPGNTCLTSLRKLKENFNYSADNASKGCGTVMRAAPFGLSEHYSPTSSRGDDGILVLKMAKYDALLTHGHSTASDASMALANIIYKIVQKNNTLENAIITSFEEGSEVELICNKAIHMATDKTISDIDAIHSLGEGWVAEEALAIALFCAVRYQNDFKKAIQTAVNHNGDSDSTGAICGNILGAWLGVESVQQAFDTSDLELCDVILEIASDLYQVVEGNTPLYGANTEWDRKYSKEIR